MTTGQDLIDTSDMYAIHNAIRRALGDAPGQLQAVAEGDEERAGQLAGYLGEVLWLLHAHHDGEDELLYPLLRERAPEQAELFDRMESQHSSVSASLESARVAVEQYGRSASTSDGQQAAVAISSLSQRADEHLTEEENDVLPVAAYLITAAEWSALPGHALRQYPGSRMWLPFGLVLEAMPTQARQDLLSQLPPPVLGMWTGGGSEAFANEMSSIRAGS